MFLSVIPTSKNLFQKAIPQSGNSFMYNTLESSTPVAATYMEMGGAKSMRDMMKKSSAELVRLYEKVKAVRLTDTVKDYLPTCDGKFLPENPFKALKDGAARGIKFLTGTTADEWRYLAAYGETFCEIIRGNYKELSPIVKKSDFENGEEIYKKWLKNRADDEENFIDFANNLDWRVNQELTAEYQSNFDDVYFYLFSEQSPVENLRSCHMVDVPYTFNTGNNFVPNPNQNLVKIIQSTWAAFATTGNPDNESIPHWEKYSVNNRQTMELNSKGCVCHKDLNTQNLNALRYIYET